MDQEYRRGRDANTSAAVIVAVIFHSQFSCTLFIPLIPFRLSFAYTLIICLQIGLSYIYARRKDSVWILILINLQCSAQLKPSLPVTGWNYGVQKFQGCAALHYKVRKRQCWLMGVGCGND
jgi:hypothetical protein